MANKNPNRKGLKAPWKKGESGNPYGRPPDIMTSTMKALNREQMRDLANTVICGRFEDLEEMAAGGARFHTLQVLVAASLIGAYKRKEFMTVDQVLNRIIGKVRDEPDEPPPPSKYKKSFVQFCVDAGYPAPYPKQVEMMEFASNTPGAHMLLGARGYGKTDYTIIMGTAYELYLDATETSLILTKSDERNVAIINEIAEACLRNGLTFEKQNQSLLRLTGHIGKDHSVSALTIGAKSLRGRHPKRAKLDDPVTEDDVSEATRKRVKRVYNEVNKLTQNVFIVGQPVHKYDLFEELRPLVTKMEVPHGSIPELDHDLIAQKAAGVSHESIQASYYLKVISEAGFPLEKCNTIDNFTSGDSVAFIDPSFKGVDYTALTIMRGHFDGVVVQGHLHKRAWNVCLEEMVTQMRACKVRRICFETNAIGDQPVLMLRELLKDSGIGVVGKDSTGNKHARILSAGAYSNLIWLAKTSDKNYIEQVIKYEYGSKNDDAPDSLAGCLEWIGLIRGKTKR